jgi:hypothetical protein
MRQTHVHVGDMSKKSAIGDETKPLSFQKVGPDNRQHEVIGFGYFIVPFGTKKCHSQYVLLHL